MDRASERDTTTLLLNKGAFASDIEARISDAQKDSLPLSLVMIDLDHFKPINDTQGHLAGDNVLRAVAETIELTVKGRGVAYRWGGDEFAALLPNHTLLEAAGLAERIRVNIVSLGLKVTASIGVSADARDSEQFLDQADKAMYEAKKLGKDLVRYFGEPPPEPEKPRTLEPPRKEPVKQSPYDAHARSEIRRNYFQSGIARCPFDSARLEVRADYIRAGRTQDLIVDCPMCGVQDIIFGPD